MLHDPLVGAVCDPEEILQMTDDMLVAQAEWLPQYEATGTRVHRMTDFHGAARLHTKTVCEIPKRGRSPARTSKPPARAR